MKIDTDFAAAFAVSVLLHALGLAFLPLGGADGSGASEADQVSVASTPAIMVTLEHWDSTPEVVTDTARTEAPTEDGSPDIAVRPDVRPETTTAEAPPLPAEEFAAFTRPDAVAAPRAVTETVTSLIPPGPEPDRTASLAFREEAVALRTEPTSVISPTAPEKLPTAQLPPAAPDRAPETAERPKRKPVPAPTESVARRVASGEGIGATRGSARADAVPQVSAAARQSAQAAWAAQIQSRIARHQTYPRGSRDEGKVRVAMVILANGELDKVSVVASSGAPLLDNAALMAVQRAAPFPPAPKELTDRWFKFGQWIAFELR